MKKKIVGNKRGLAVVNLPPRRDPTTGRIRRRSVSLKKGEVSAETYDKPDWESKYVQLAERKGEILLVAVGASNVISTPAPEEEPKAKSKPKGKDKPKG